MQKSLFTGENSLKKKNKQLENYVIKEVHRGELKNAPYNPRKISKEAKDKLKANIERVGLLEPAIWNERTGNIVGGHQRISIIDSIKGTKDYKIKVAAVDLDEKTEVEQNMFLNNISAQGYFDIEALEKLLSEPYVTIDEEEVLLDLDNIGFTAAEIYQNIGSKPFDVRPQHLVDLADELRKNREVLKKLQDGLTAADYETEAYCVIVFKDYGERLELLEKLKMPDMRYIDGQKLLNVITQSHE